MIRYVTLLNCVYKLTDSQIAWVIEIKQLDNYINKTLSDKLDCQNKLPTFIESVNKLNIN